MNPLVLETIKTTAAIMASASTTQAQKDSASASLTHLLEFLKRDIADFSRANSPILQ